MTVSLRWRLATAFSLVFISLPGFLLGVALVTIVTYLTRAWRWGYLLAPLARVRLLDLFSATTVGFMTGLVIPRAGEVVRPYLVGRRHAIPVSAAFASIILERLLDLITVIVLFGAYLYVLPMPAAQTRGPLLGHLKTGAALAGAAAALVLVILLAFRLRGEPSAPSVTAWRCCRRRPRTCSPSSPSRCCCGSAST